MADLNRTLDIWLSIAGGIVIAVTIALVILMLLTDGESRFDSPVPTTAASTAP